MKKKKTTQYVLIDIANGHMSDLYNTAKIAKEQYGNLLVLMIGNVANPKTFLEYCKIGVDYIRCGIGSGSACTTSANVAIGYPMASLINECYLIKKEGNFDTKIVADGGFKNYSDIIKGLALGADRIMLGSMLNKCLESSGKNYVCNDKQDNYCEYSKTGFDIKALLPLMKQGKIYKKYRGMSTKEVQKDWGKEIIKTAEGISKFNKVEYTLAGFIENLEDYLRSAMSYTGSLTLEDFKGTNFELITQASFNRFNK